MSDQVVLAGLYLGAQRGGQRIHGRHVELERMTCYPVKPIANVWPDDRSEPGEPAREHGPAARIRGQELH